MKKYIRILILFVIVGCKSGYENNDSLVEVDQSVIRQHIEHLASDDFQGRMPFTEGETKTVNYLKEEFHKLGLKPGNGDSYFQDVPVVEIFEMPSEKMLISSTDEVLELNYLSDFMAVTLKKENKISLEESELVFAGYGIVAPEYGWNDYEGIDWTEKTAIVLVNDPGFGSGDSSLFRGNDMTYYGRWTYKFEEAARQGASGVIIIHETVPAGYGWNLIVNGLSNSQINLKSKTSVADIQGWITNEAAIKLFDASKIENKDFRNLAGSKDFKPVPLGLNVSMKVNAKFKEDASKNVIAILPGTERKDEYIIYSAHWDHLGIGRAVENDSIYNGAADNATGTACLLAIAKAFKKEKQNKRSVIFLATALEEKGLLGSAFYVENPIYPLSKTVANINIDLRYDNHGPMKDFTVVGYGHSEMDEYAKEAANKQGRYVMPDFETEKGYFFRMDQFNFAKAGIPFLCGQGMYEHFEKGIDFTLQKNKEYLNNKYHQPFDDYNPETFELSGIRLDAQLWFEIGLELANDDYFPKWYDNSEFKAARKNKQSNE